jgi:hypothetical protein
MTYKDDETDPPPAPAPPEFVEVEFERVMAEVFRV